MLVGRHRYRHIFFLLLGGASTISRAQFGTAKGWARQVQIRAPHLVQRKFCGTVGPNIGLRDVFSDFHNFGYVLANLIIFYDFLVNLRHFVFFLIFGQLSHEQPEGPRGRAESA